MYCVIFVHFVYSSALNTQLVDNTFPEDDFEVVLGSLEVKWQRIGPYLSLSWTFFNTCICFWNHSVLYIVYIWCISIMRIYNMNTILLCWKASQLAFFTFLTFYSTVAWACHIIGLSAAYGGIQSWKLTLVKPVTMWPWV